MSRRAGAEGRRLRACIHGLFVFASCGFLQPLVSEFEYGMPSTTGMHAGAHAHSRLSHTQHTTHVDFMHSNIRSSLCPRPRICTHSPPTSVTHALGLLSRPRLTWRPRRRPIERKRPRTLRCSLSSSLALRESGLHLTCLCLYM